MEINKNLHLTLKQEWQGLNIENYMLYLNCTLRIEYGDVLDLTGCLPTRLRVAGDVLRYQQSIKINANNVVNAENAFSRRALRAA